MTVFDASDMELESAFWAGVLGGTVDAEDDWHMVLVNGALKIGVQLAPTHVPPQWPDGDPQQIHVDLWVEDISSAHQEVMDQGLPCFRTRRQMVRPLSECTLTRLDILSVCVGANNPRNC